MKKNYIIILVFLIICKMAIAQDTIYIYKSGSVVSKRALYNVDSVKPIISNVNGVQDSILLYNQKGVAVVKKSVTDIDSITFYRAVSPPDAAFTAHTLTAALDMGIMYEVHLGSYRSTVLSDYYTPAHGDIMQNAGFKTVSVRIDMAMFENSSGSAPTYTLASDFWADLDFIVNDLLNRGQMVLIAPKGLEDGTQLSLDKQVAWWSQIAFRYRGYTNRLLFRLMNEPLTTNFPNGITDIETLYQALTNAVRPTNPTRYIVVFAQRKTETGPGATDFNIMKIPTNATPYLMDFHAISGNATSAGLSKSTQRIQQAYEFRAATGIPVWSGAWSIGSWDSTTTPKWDLTMAETIAAKFGSTKIPGMYLMFNGGNTSIYDISQDANGNGVLNEWTQPGIPPIITNKGPYNW